MASPDRQNVREAVRLRRLSDEMDKLDRKIDKASMGSEERLSLLRKQASISDERQTLRDRRGM
ncbi:MAG: hypothetical protein M3P44_17355 [Actinomycetota bacterium]|nr:hypothetical protein [Actinomycetota bacterium]